MNGEDILVLVLIFAIIMFIKQQRKWRKDENTEY